MTCLPLPPFVLFQMGEGGEGVPGEFHWLRQARLRRAFLLPHFVFFQMGEGREGVGAPRLVGSHTGQALHGGDSHQNGLTTRDDQPRAPHMPSSLVLTNLWISQDLRAVQRPTRLVSRTQQGTFTFQRSFSDGRSATGRSFPTCHLRTFYRHFSMSAGNPYVLAVIFHHSMCPAIEGTSPEIARIVQGNHA